MKKGIVEKISNANESELSLRKITITRHSVEASYKTNILKKHYKEAFDYDLPKFWGSFEYDKDKNSTNDGIKIKISFRGDYVGVGHNISQGAFSKIARILAENSVEVVKEILSAMKPLIDANYDEKRTEKDLQNSFYFTSNGKFITKANIISQEKLNEILKDLNLTSAPIKDASEIEEPDRSMW